ncbi:hypothetical protein ACFL2L_01595, partial [Patescibacteria group bacterium]
EDELKGRILQATIENILEHHTESEIEETLDEITAKITVVNEHSVNQKLVATTRFLTDNGELFRLKKYIEAPANGQVEAEIYADDPKQIIKEIPEGQLTIPGLRKALQSKIYGKIINTIKPNTGKVKIIKEDDIERAKNEASEDLSKRAIIQFAKEIKSGEKILPKSINKEILEFKIDKKIGEKTATFNSQSKVIFTAVIFDEDELLSLGKHHLEQSIADDKQLLEIKEDGLLYFIEKYDLESNTANIKVSLTGKVAINEKHKKLNKENISGMDKEEALIYFKTVKEIKKIEIITSPSWWSRLPRLESGITIEIIKN